MERRPWSGLKETLDMHGAESYHAIVVDRPSVFLTA